MALLRERLEELEASLAAFESERQKPVGGVKGE
jgi:hypothetical protein